MMCFYGAIAQAVAGPDLESSPLAALSGPPGSTLFTYLPSDATGIVVENRYADPRMWQEKFDEFKFGAIGTGAAVGDYDGDGKPDVLVVSKTEQSRLFKNLGGWKFADVTAKAGIVEPGKPTAWTQGAAFADVNNDGRLDLYLCRFNSPNLLFVNQGDGTFKEEAHARGLAVVDASVMGAFCDYDRDGWLDVYVQTNLLDVVKSPVGQKDYLFRNRGDGTFEDVTARAGIAGETMGHSATWWDYDADGWPDLYVANDFAPPDCLYRNNRDGTFTNAIGQALEQMPHSAMGSDLGDVDNDGWTDLLVSDMAATTREKDQRGVAKIRALLDTNPDDPNAPLQFMRSTLLLGTGTPWLRESALYAGVAATDWTWSVRFEDFDNDGQLDLHVTNGMVRELHNADLVQDISATESRAAALRLERAAPVFAEHNLAYRNDGDGRFREVGKAWGLDQLGVSFGAATGDFDGDGDLDLIYGNYESGPTVLRNDSRSGHRVTVALRGTRLNRFGIGAVVRLDSASRKQMRTLVLARGYLSTSEPVLHFGLGDDRVIEKLTVEWPSGHVQQFANLPADQKLTITEPADPAEMKASRAFAEPPFTMEQTELVARERPEPETNSQPLIPFRFDRRGPALAVLPNETGGQLLLGGTTQDSMPGITVDSLDDGPLLVFEANGDGRPDLLQTKAGISRTSDADYQPKLHLAAAGGYADGVLPSIPQSTGAVCAADYDRDGDLDVFLGARVLPGKYPLSPRSVLLRNDEGQFVESTLPRNGELGMVTSAVWSDLDQDGWTDLVMTTEWGTVLFLRNDEGKEFNDRSAEQGFTELGLWTSLVSADFNRDGKPDYVVGNVGLNTPYQSGPAVLFQGRFGDGGPPAIIEAVQEDDQLYPRRSRNELGLRVTGLLRRFPRHNEYAKATLPELLGANRLAKARRFEARELRSGIYLSQVDGTHRFEVLPWPAQLAPLQGMVALDLTGDGAPDLCAVQNSHASTPSLGRFTGGLGVALVNDGHGRFHALAPLESGLIVPGDAKALVITDFNRDGWPDLVASRNDETALRFRHGQTAGRRPLRVTLQGPAGNPTAVGAQLTVIYADGSTHSAEITAGSGYYSQSVPAAFFASSSDPRTVAVRWTDGSNSQHDLTADRSPIVVIRQP